VAKVDQPSRASELLGCFAAVHEVRRTRDERRLIDARKTMSARPLRSPYTVERHSRRQTRLSFFSTVNRFSIAVSIGPGATGNDAHAGTRCSSAADFSQPFDRVLAGGIYRRTGRTGPAVGRRYIDDTAVPLGPASREAHASMLSSVPRRWYRR